MTGLHVSPIELKVGFIKFGRTNSQFQILVASLTAALTAIGNKRCHRYPYGDTGMTAAAVGAINVFPTATKTHL
jgi:hypothetical protein